MRYNWVCYNGALLYKTTEFFSCEVHFDTSLCFLTFSSFSSFTWFSLDLTLCYHLLLSCQHIFLLNFWCCLLWSKFYPDILCWCLFAWTWQVDWELAYFLSSNFEAQKFRSKPYRFFDEFLTIFIWKHNNLFQCILWVCHWNRLKALLKLLK